MREFAQVPITFTLAPHSDADTSRAAAKAIVEHLPHLELRVLEYLKDCGPTGSTNEETADALKMVGDTVRPRMVTLRARGLVKDSGLRRRTHSLRKAVVWVVT